MKSIVVYYSVSGQTEKVAKLIAKKEKSDILKIETVEEIKPDIFSRYYKGMKSMISSNNMKLKPYFINVEDYDRVILGFPNWGSDCPSAVKSFIDENNFENKDIYLFTTYLARGANSCLNNVSKYFINSRVCAVEKFSLPSKKSEEELIIKIDKFIE